MSTKSVGHASWVQNLNLLRKEAIEESGASPGPSRRARAGAGEPADAGAPPRLVARLGVAGVPEKVAERHGESLRPAAGDAAAIADLIGTKLEAWRGRSVQRIVDQFYKALGQALDQAPAEARPDLARQSVHALRGLFDRVGPSDQLGAATSAAVGLFELGMRELARGALAVTPKEVAAAMGDATQAISDLIGTLSDRPGLGSALNIFPVLVEQLESREAALTPASRRAIWAEVAAFLARTAPLSGFSQEISAELTKALADAIAADKPGATAARTLEAAARAFQRPRARGQAEVQDQLASRRVHGLPVRAPGRPSFDRLNASLEKTLAAHPAGPAELNRAIFQLRARAIEELGRFDPGRQKTDPWVAAAQLLDKLGPTEQALPALEWLAESTRAMRDERFAAGLARAAEAEKPAEVARRLAEAVLARAGYTPADLEGLGAALDGLSKLPPSRAFSAFFALAGVLADPGDQTAAIVRRITRLASEGGKDDLATFLRRSADRIGSSLSQLEYQNFGGQDAAAVKENIAAQIARASAGVPDAEEATEKLADLLSTVHVRLPRAQLAELVAAEGPRRPGIWTLVDPSVRYRHDVSELLGRVFGALARSPIARSTPEAQTEAARFGLYLTEVAAKLDGDPDVPMERITADVTKAFQRPQDLTPAQRGRKAAGLRGDAKPSVEAYLRAHEELPLELALTAGLHLTAAQSGWLLEHLGAATGRDTRRRLRDFVFACVSARKLDLVEAVRSTKAPAKAINRAISFVARAYREGKLGELVPWKALIEGFRANQDPIAAVEQKRIDATLAEVGLAKIPKDELNERGLEEVASCGEAITYLLDYFKKGHVEDGIDHLRFRAPLLAVLESVARGTWPATKYEDEAGRRQMAALTPEQQAIWREETVISAKDGPRGDQPELRRALALAKGLGKALRREAKLEVPGLPELGWNKPSLARVEARFAELGAAIRAVEKGSPEHKRLGVELGVVRDAVVLLRLHFAIQGAGEEPSSALLALRQPLQDATATLRRQGLAGALQAAVDISFAARDVRSSPRQGVYAVDEDRLEPLLMSTTGGCIHYTGMRRWANASLAANANEKIVRVYDGENFVYRAIIRFHEVELRGYKGPAIWVNEANVNGGGEDEHRELLLRQVLAKAAAMKVPVITSQNDLTSAAKSMRLVAGEREVKLRIDGGNTDAIFTDYTLSSDVRAARGGAKLWETEVDLTVVMPR